MTLKINGCSILGELSIIVSGRMGDEIDRLIWFLTDGEIIRDVIEFPTMKSVKD